jgi:beta-galactosidase
MSDLTRRQLVKSGLLASATSFLSLHTSEAEAMASGITTVSSVRDFNAASHGTPQERLLMDANWKFALGSADDPEKDFNYGELSRGRTFAKSGHIQQATAMFDDSSWRTVDLPHDWAVELPFTSTKSAPEQGGRPLGRTFPETSVGWYRKAFDLPAEDKNKRIQLQFDGIYRDAAIFLNGHYLTTNFSGYAPLYLDITDWVNTGGSNQLAVRVDATLGDGWFYEGAGIYRHVWLIKKAPVHLIEWGTYVRTSIISSSAKVELGSEVKNDSDQPQRIRVAWSLFDQTGASVAISHSEEFVLSAGSTQLFKGVASVRNPALWSIESPVLYQAVATVRLGDAELDSDAITFGIRTVRFDAKKGFFLNDRPVKIKGTCCHQDHAGVGVALPDRIQYFRVELLKAMGSNGLRTSHNPPTPELMDATDTLGMVVMCETRMMDSSPEGLSQLDRMIRRFRNHPSIVIWSLGNEEPEQGTARGARIVNTMKQLAYQLDPNASLHRRHERSHGNWCLARCGRPGIQLQRVKGRSIPCRVSGPALHRHGNR